MWRGPRPTHDPALSNQAWFKIRAYWKRQRQPCARCGRPIDYDGSQYIVVNGRRRQNPRYLVVGHIISRREARLAGWPEDQINSIANTQPECVACSNRSGAQLGKRMQKAKQRRVRQLDDSRRW